jgi:glutathione reductase (NADPH)
VSADGQPFDVDFFVIGGGSGGVRAARIAAGHGARVALAEHDRMGGTCVIRGCVPKKLLVYGSEVRAQLAAAAGLGWTVPPATHSWPTLQGAVAAEVTRLSGIYQGLMDRAGVRVVRGRARLIGPHQVEVTGERGAEVIRARHVLIATGGRPQALTVPGADLPGVVLVSDDMFALPALPARLLVVGAGFIGVEFAHVMAGLGVEVTLAYRHPLVLPMFDDDLRRAVEDGLRHAGVVLRPDVELAGLRPGADGGAVASLAAGDPVACDRVLAAIGRAPASGGLGMTELGVALDRRGAIVVDAHGQSSLPWLHAAGDVTAAPALTPVAIRAGHGIADRLFGPTELATAPGTSMTSPVASAVFAQPPAAAVGQTEAQAIAAGHDVQIFRTTFRPMKHALTGELGRAMMKLVVDRPSQRVLGLHVVCDAAPEIVQAAAIAITMGATKADFDRTVAVHPTLAEELVLMR